MATGKEKAFPKECCGVCHYYHPQGKDDGACFSQPPKVCSDGDGFTWLRGGFVAPSEPACIDFKPKCHA